MDLTLNRTAYRQDGIFGEIRGIIGDYFAITLEHAYPLGAVWVAKIPPGEYLCKRGMHNLFRLPNSFETFEVTGVDGHTGLLFHPGNYDNDSEGCILLGQKIMNLGFGQEMISNSKQAFADFMALQAGLDTFNLEVIA